MGRLLGESFEEDFDTINRASSAELERMDFTLREKIASARRLLYYVRKKRIEKLDEKEKNDERT